MKKIYNSFILTLSAITLLTGCQENDEPETHKQTTICEIGNTGKVVSSFNVTTGKDGSSRTLASNMTFQYSPDYSKVMSYDLSEGMPGMLMNDYSFVLHGDEVVDSNGEIVVNDFKFNDKGYVSHLVGFKGFSSSQGTTHVTYDIAYNAEDRMSKITYKFLDAEKKWFVPRTLTFSGKAVFSNR